MSLLPNKPNAPISLATMRRVSIIAAKAFGSALGQQLSGDGEYNMNARNWVVVQVVVLATFSLGGQDVCIGEHPQQPSSQPAKDLVCKVIATEKKGYVPRPCGFDMNRNGRLNEPADALVGNGTTTDPDGDGVDEDIIYVDSEAGNDVVGDGSSKHPYKTRQQAMDAADGPDDDCEDIICISGVFKEELTLTQSGAAAHYTRDKFQFPRNPFMIIGWDKDGDGKYPPYDRDDVAVLDGKGVLDMAITNRPNKVSNVEIAHLTIRDYGSRQSEEDRGAFRFSGDGSGRQSHLFIHDVEIRQVTVGDPGNSKTIVASFWSEGNTLTHVAVINVLVDGVETWFARGAPGNGSGRFRFENITLKLYGKSSNVRRGWKMWGNHSQVEILNNVIDGTCPDPNTWHSRNFVWGMRPSQCARDWTIRGNVFLNLTTAISLKGYAGPNRKEDYCQFRSVNNITIDRNIIANTDLSWNEPPKGIEIRGGGPSVRATVENVTITNNLMYSSVEWTPILSMAGNNGGPQPGTIIITGNTIIGPFSKSGIRISRRNEEGYTRSNRFPQNRYVVKKNILSNAGSGCTNISLDYAPTNWVANGNTYDSKAGFIWNDRLLDNFSMWREASGQDTSSSVGSTQCLDAAVRKLSPDSEYDSLRKPGFKR